MDYKTHIKTPRFQALRTFSKHPYFGFIMIGLFLALGQVLGQVGLIGTSLVRSFGYTSIYMIVGLGFALLLGYAGLASLGTAGFVGLGTYIMGYLAKTHDIPFLIVIIIAIVIAILVGLIVGFISLRIEGMYLAIVTLGLSEILNEVFKNAYSITNGTNGLSIFGVGAPRELAYYMAIAFLLVMMIITFNVMKSPSGRAMLAMKNSDSAAQAMGVSILKYRLIAFIFATVYAVIAGVLYVNYSKFTIPSSWSLSFSLNILAAVIVGGASTITGIFLGTFLIFGLNLGILQQFDFFSQNSAYSVIFNGVLIIVVIMFYPGGLSKLLTNLSYRIKSKYQALKLKWLEYTYGKDE
jgi:branched-chain amino acid transport system permease protein